jgi:uncharacterized protein YunC (DUF1805 family)
MSFQKDTIWMCGYARGQGTETCGRLTLSTKGIMSFQKDTIWMCGYSRGQGTETCGRLTLSTKGIMSFQKDTIWMCGYSRTKPYYKTVDVKTIRPKQT